MNRRGFLVGALCAPIAAVCGVSAARRYADGGRVALWSGGPIMPDPSRWDGYEITASRIAAGSITAGKISNSDDPARRTVEFDLDAGTLTLWS